MMGGSSDEWKKFALRFAWYTHNKGEYNYDVI
jgi:hypothetical protein